MCGIAGFFGYKKNEPTKDQINKCLNLMQRRGPDFQNFNLYNFENMCSLMLHSRLSIIDPVKNSNQPMEDTDGVLSFNGEIYNYLELKKKFKFGEYNTQSDTEVFLKYLAKNNSVPQNNLDGMWSYAYFSKKNKTLTLCRDRFGEKPLYILKHNKNFYYGSNLSYIFALSGLKKEFNDEKIVSFISYGFKSLFLNNETFFKKIKTLEASTALKVNKQLKLSKVKIWLQKPIIKIKKSSYDSRKKELKSLLIDIFSKRLRSDYPVACLLSGGIDSAAIVSLAKKYNKTDLHCFSIQTEDKNYDESSRIKDLCEKNNIKSNFIRLDKFNNYNFLEKIISDTHFPLCSISYLVYAHLNQEIHNRNFRVLLTGIGGDEIFGGYYTHQINYLVSNQKQKNFPNYYNDWKKYTKPLIRSKILSDLNYYKKQLKKKLPSFHEKDEVRKFIKSKLKLSYKEKKYCNNFFKNQLAIDLFRDTVPPQILSADQVSMYFSIENRTPFLSHELFEYSNSLPDDSLINNGYGKAILRDALQNVLPKSITSFREKIGFYANLNKFFNTNSKEFKDQLFQSNYINKIINMNKVNRLLKKNYMNNAEAKFVFCILNLAILTKKN